MDMSNVDTMESGNQLLVSYDEVWTWLIHHVYFLAKHNNNNNNSNNHVNVEATIDALILHKEKVRWSKKLACSCSIAISNPIQLYRLFKSHATDNTNIFLSLTIFWHFNIYLCHCIFNKKDFKKFNWKLSFTPITFLCCKIHINAF